MVAQGARNPPVSAGHNFDFWSGKILHTVKQLKPTQSEEYLAQPKINK